MPILLVRDLRNDTGTDGAATFADSEAQAVFDGDGYNQLNGHLEVVAGHDHHNTFGQRD